MSDDNNSRLTYDVTTTVDRVDRLTDIIKDLKTQVNDNREYSTRLSEYMESYREDIMQVDERLDELRDDIELIKSCGVGSILLTTINMTLLALITFKVFEK